MILLKESKFPFKDYVWLLKCCKNTFLHSIFFYLKNHIFIFNQKYIYFFVRILSFIFFFVRILSFKENIFIFNQSILMFKNLLYSNGFFFRIKIFFLIQLKKNVFDEIFLFNEFR